MFVLVLTTHKSLFMNLFQKLRTEGVFKWVSLNFSENLLKSSKPLLLGAGPFRTCQNPRFYGRNKRAQSERLESPVETLTVNCDNVSPISRKTRAQAQAALLEYLHSTRSLQFIDAENMSKNSPFFIKKILEKVKNKAEIGSSITRFLRYHPINEFEPFFESLGLKPSEFVSLLPRDLMFLSDDQVLLENYYVLCNYGIARNKIGKICKEAPEVFRYDSGVLQLKLQDYIEMGLSQSAMIKAVASSPYLLIGDANREFVKMMERLKSVGIESSWMEKHLSEGNHYDWSQMLDLLSFFSKMGFNGEQLGELIRQHPGILLECSGNMAFSFVGLLLKLGLTLNEIYMFFLQFPPIEFGKFYRNFRHCYLFLIEIEMDIEEIGRIVHSHTVLLGSCALKRANSLLTNLSVGKKRLCSIIKDNPQELKKWVLGSKVGPLPNSGEDLKSQIRKTKFLSDLGYVENTKEFEKAFKLFRGNGMELQERFDFLVKYGLDRKDITETIKVAPHILNQSINVLEMKINYLIHSLGYPVSSLVTFPSYLSYTSERVELRMSMCNWLKDQGVAEPNLALSTIIACGEDYFIDCYVNRHPKGAEIWQTLKHKIYSL